MFHICLCANEPYAKYTAVLISSIVKSTDFTKSFSDFFAPRERERESKVREIGTFAHQSALDSYAKCDFESLSESQRREGYIFHIFSDFFSEDSRTKFATLAQNLSQIYPCEIRIHICESTLFSGLPMLNGNHLAYFRLLIPRFMPKDCAICLYLDIDMLVVGDLRGLFALEMGEFIVGVVSDYVNNSPKLRSKSANHKDIYFKGAYFNSGFLLINLCAWERENITARCFEVMKNYHLCAHDQDTLNAVIDKSMRLYLPFAFNVLIRAYSCAICKGESLRYKFDFTREAMNRALKSPVILHFAGEYKAWSNARIMNEKWLILSDLWWEVALNTPNFDEILRVDLANLNAVKIYESRVAVYLLGFTRNFWGFFALPFVAMQIFGKNAREVLATQEILDSRSLNPHDYNFAFEIFALAQKSWCRRKKGDLLILPFRAMKLKYRHKRYGMIL